MFLITKLIDKKDNKYLDKIRYQAGYNPFSFSFNKLLSQKLFEDAQSENVSPNVLSIIKMSNYLYENFHVILTKQLENLIQEINLPKEELRELFIGFVNEQELYNQKRFNEYLVSINQVTAFETQNAVIVSEDQPGNPQNFTAVSETIIEFANTFLRYLTFCPDVKTMDLSERKNDETIFQLLSKIFLTTNNYCGIKTHFDNCLFHNGNIEIMNDGAIFFNSSLNDLLLIEQVGITMMENQRFSRKEYYELNLYRYPIGKQVILANSSKRILDRIKFEGGFIKYTLRTRELEDYVIYLDYLVSIKDYYPFYEKKPLSELGNLTITKFLQLDAELKELVYKIYKLGPPEINEEHVAKFKKNFVPKILVSVLKSYLRSVSNCSEEQIDIFLSTSTTQHIPSLNLYSTHLIKENNYYYFPFLPAIKTNYFFLIDYWLEKAKEDLTKRGKLLENYAKEQLKSAVQKEYNKFQVVNKSKFFVSQGIAEEIDLLIQTKNTLIVAEIKCVKYPMYERDYYSILSTVLSKAVEQIKNKCLFLDEYKNNFTHLYSLDGRKIDKVIILNLPVYTGLVIDGVAIIDINSFLSYFKSGEVTGWIFDKTNMEKVETIQYYKTEDEFCNNFESYLQKNPLSQFYLSKLQITNSYHTMDGFPSIIFSDIIPIEK